MKNQSAILPEAAGQTVAFENRGRRIGIFVIAYNAESQIAQTLGRIPDDLWKAITVVYVIDDCSTDETVEKAMAFDRWQDKLVVLRNRVNRRYGGNQKLGYQYAIDNNLDAVVMLHADGQYAPEMLPALLEPLVKDEADVVIGSRMMQRGKALAGGMPLYKYSGNIVLTRIQNALCGTSFSEYHSGYRAYRVDLLRQLPFWENSNEWHFDSQILLQAVEAKARIAEVPIPTYYGDEICHVNGIVYGMQCVLTALKFFLFKRRVVYSRIFDVRRAGGRYVEKFNDPYSSHSKIWNWLSRRELRGTRVLELGVGDASLTRKLHEAGAVIDSIDLDARCAELARPYCRQVRVSDLDEPGAMDLNEMYDIVLAADVLEHLRDPEFVLSKVKKCLKKNGYLVVSLPNIANLYVRLNLLVGRFPYHTKGILDRTHLHFFSLTTAEQMLTKTGWVIESRDVTSIPLAIVFPFLAHGPFRLLLQLLHVKTRLLRGLLAYQGLYFCVNPNHPHLL